MTSKRPVTIIGLGAMGTALAEAYLNAGHPTTVWNRTAKRMEPLVAQGAIGAATAAEAVEANDLVIACLSGYEATMEALAEAKPAGRTLVTLNSGTPRGARAMAEWAAEREVRFLGGAVKNVPSAVGLPDTLLYYSGDRDVFDEYEETLRVMGGDTVHLGADPDLAALHELGVGGILLPSLLGFYQGAALVGSRGVTARSIVPYATKWLEMIIALLPEQARRIDERDYGEPESALGLFYDTIPGDHEIGVEGNLDVEWHRPIHDLLQRAVDLGHHDDSIAALVEVLKKEEDSE
ncbi:NAD(P)-binding domain-containing protein [Nocardiopsis alba]|uniref:NAD(P)-binding domain-containing protein n=1 Tax=Nocardiopsis alba TaxID=53437 RepID=A0A7K2IRW6_9ACTN|nr:MULTISPECIES: NAD(P)-binding domain-containing protein [Nocardiopsis]MEC3895311.1 NAD(P)-binding domain-containing protein [Nocardiopsis sp. LDBS1602]MYR32720.1 NAD(P)-binding domain-containing protein [Nocardiopsis alba]